MIYLSCPFRLAYYLLNCHHYQSTRRKLCCALANPPVAAMVVLSRLRRSLSSIFSYVSSMHSGRKEDGVISPSFPLLSKTSRGFFHLALKTSALRHELYILGSRKGNSFASVFHASFGMLSGPGALLLANCFSQFFNAEWWYLLGWGGFSTLPFRVFREEHVHDLLRCLQVLWPFWCLSAELEGNDLVSSTYLVVYLSLMLLIVILSFPLATSY